MFICNLTQQLQSDIDVLPLVIATRQRLGEPRSQNGAGVRINVLAGQRSGCFFITFWALEGHARSLDVGRVTGLARFFECHVARPPLFLEIPDHRSLKCRFIRGRVMWAEEGDLGSAHLIAARVTGADPKVLAAVIRGAVAPALPAEQLRTIEVPVLVLNGKADVANQKVGKLLKAIPTSVRRNAKGTIRLRRVQVPEVSAGAAPNRELAKTTWLPF